MSAHTKKKIIFLFVFASIFLTGNTVIVYAAESIITEHPDDIVNILVFALVALGTLFVSLLSWAVLSRFTDIGKKLDALDSHVRQQVGQLSLRVHANELDIAHIKAQLASRRREGDREDT